MGMDGEEGKRGGAMHYVNTTDCFRMFLLPIYMGKEEREGLLILNFFNLFWLPICFKPYKMYYGHKNTKNTKILKKYQKNTDSGTAGQTTLSN